MKCAARKSALQDAYTNAVMCNQDALKKIGEVVDAQSKLGCTEANWGDVGTAAEVAHRLTEICRFLNLEEGPGV